MIRRRILTVALGLGLGLGAAAEAASVANLYRAIVPIADKSDAEVQRATAQALENVIVKLTGSSGAPRDGRARALLAKAARYESQFGFERPEGPGGPLALRVDFDQRALAQALRQQGLPVWGHQRPESLLWLVVTDANGRHIAGSDEYQPALEAIQDRAQQRGLPLVLPLQDINETQLIASEKTGPDLDQALLTQSERYGAPAVLIGQITQTTDQQWDARWTLKIEEESMDWKRHGETIEAVLADGVDVLGDALGRRYANVAQASGEVAAGELTVEGVNTVEDYARALDYLRSVDAVSKVSVRRVLPGKVVFKLDAHGGLAAVAGAVQFGRVLLPLPGIADAYQLAPREGQ
ncbi:MAG: DUF2066 domain-containing protein [Gammaproteobacteria bacterium]|nr:DUF2066 domain-containing protein [Gammaproteobacteria bacterium]